MRSNKSFTIRENFSALRKVWITKLSLAMIQLLGIKKVIVVRDGGFGDAIMAIPLLHALKTKYSKQDFLISTNFPELFPDENCVRHTRYSFPIIWLSYTHYDFNPWKTKRAHHCRAIMAELAGIDQFLEKKYEIPLAKEDYLTFVHQYVLDQKYVVLQPHAGPWFLEKNWLADRWELLVADLTNKGYSVYQIGVSNDELINGVVDFRGKTEVLESLILIKHAQFLIGVNSFGEQAAYLFDIPAIILYGPTNPKYSLNIDQLAVYGNEVRDYEELENLDYQFRDMDSIRVSTVLKAVSLINMRKTLD